MQNKRGFTLVEILIVVVILGILAAIVIPQFTQASTEAKMNSLRSDLQSLRSQIELYKAQHDDIAPGALNGTFAEQMIYTSSRLGSTSGNKVRTPTYEFGPYLERVPVNPFNGVVDPLYTNGAQGLVETIAGIGAKISPGDDTASWQYVTATGEIWADNAGSTTDGTKYADF
ncbi:MAG: prepilin-type N-terminal cleavage/methylation domain-containing protein [Planctomycetes bacterium]|nr:prepilin-type N-terminal cleavage/methylation domain-containing protein [Planctomycetota bacterium]